MSKLKAIDLFCGAGGLTLGLKKAGFDVLAGVEVAEPAISTYISNHKDHRVFGEDIKNISPKLMMEELGINVGELDLLAGCPPCQGFSTHRTRNKVSSVKDSRNDLVFEFLRFVKAILPKTIMMENVPGLAKDERVKSLLISLRKLGYKIDADSVKIKDAADFGVPQRRKRMILIASRYGLIEEPKKARKRQTVRDALSNLKKAGISGDVLHDTLPNRESRIVELIKIIPKDGGSRSDIPRRYWLPCHIKKPNSYTDVYGRMAWDDVAPTITGGCNQPSKGRFLHPSENRGITFREAALLQGFPKSYKFNMSLGKDAVALMIGNALPPEFIRRHAYMIKKHILKIDRGVEHGV